MRRSDKGGHDSSLCPSAVIDGDNKPLAKAEARSYKPLKRGVIPKHRRDGCLRQPASKEKHAMPYQNILVDIALTEECHPVVARAQALDRNSNPTLHL